MRNQNFKKISAIHLELFTLVTALTLAQILGTYLPLIPDRLNIFTKRFLESVLSFIFIFIIKHLKKKPENPKSNTGTINTMYRTQISTISFASSILGEFLNLYCAEELITSIKTFDLPPILISKVSSWKYTQPAYEFQKPSSIKHLLQFIVLVLLFTSSVFNFSFFGILIFVFFIISLISEKMLQRRFRLESHNRTDYISEIYKIAISFPFFIIFGDIASIKSYKTNIQTLLHVISSLCSDLLLDTLQNNYSNTIHTQTNIYLKMLRVFLSYVKSPTGISPAQILILMLLLISHYL